MHKRQFLQLAATGGLLAASPALAQLRREPIVAIRAATIGAGVVVEVETQRGLRGHGFTAITNSPVVVSVVRDVIAGNLRGQDALAREAIYDRLLKLLVLRGLQSGHAMQAISAVDIALWDIAGKMLDQPVWRLLGGARSSVPIYNTFGQATLNREQLVAAAKANVAAGAKRLKMVVAADREEGSDLEAMFREDAARIRLVREAVGREIELYIDANHALDEYEARRFIRLIEQYDIALFEEPLRGNDVLRLADLRQHTSIPLSAGQNEGNIARWRDMILADAVDMLQFNVCMCGGYTGALKIAGLAAAFAKPIDNGGAYALFNMHLHAGVSNGGMVEWHTTAVATERQIYDPVFELNGDRLALPERPGLGFELKPASRQQLGV